MNSLPTRFGGTHILAYRFFERFAQASGCPAWRTWANRAWRRLWSHPAWMEKYCWADPAFGQFFPLQRRLFIHVDLLPLVLRVHGLSPQARAFLDEFDFGAMKEAILL